MADHVPRLCQDCGAPLTAKLRCTKCGKDWSPVPQRPQRRLEQQQQDDQHDQDGD